MYIIYITTVSKAGVYSIAGVDYEPVNIRLNFNANIRAHSIDLMTVGNDIFESSDPKRICLMINDLTEPCPDSVVIASDSTALIIDDDRKIAMHFIMRT